MDNNGEPASNSTSSVPASIWTEEKWVQTFGGLQAFGLRVIYFVICITFLCALVTNIHHPTPSCVVGRHQNEVMILKGSLSLLLLGLSVMLALGVKQEIRLAALEMARLRWRLNAKYSICAIFLVFGISLFGVAMMDAFQIVFGLWRCHSPVTIGSMVLFAFFTLVADGYWLHSIYYVIYTP